jgi:Ser/Thr protein kinase RdoA (MazF antagonist)
MDPKANFQNLTPEIILPCVEEHCAVRLQSVMNPYNSYVNRVYGLQDEDGQRYVVKFYRPGRWSPDSILEEHRFLLQCAEMDLPVIAPLILEDGSSLSEIEGIQFAVFPHRAGRTFDITSEEDWLRLGSIVGRIHQVGKSETAMHRVLCSPVATTEKYFRDLVSQGLVSPDCIDEFNSVCEQTLSLISPLFDDVANIRIHGDCHRGNILDRLEEGLLIIDFDDMMMGPAVQDLWLLLPGHFSECRTEMNLLLEGYTQFLDFDSKTVHLIEPLRFMRIIYFLTWSAMQNKDYSFEQNFSDWGTKSFWIKEIEDLNYQQKKIEEHLSESYG